MAFHHQPNVSSRDGQRWRFRLGLRVFAFAALVGWGAFLITLLITGLGTAVGPALAIDAVCAVLAWRFIFVPYLQADASGINVQNALRCHRFGWSQITSIRPGQYGIYFRLDNGKRVCASAIQKSPTALMFRWKTRSDKIAEELRERRDSSELS